MLRLLVLSDSHRDRYALERALRLHREADAVFFLGDGEEDFLSPNIQQLCRDKKVTALAGNCDFYSQLPKEELVLLGGKRILALHGHTRFVKHGFEMLEEEAERLHADLVLHGHTHIPRTAYKNGIYYLCPGSVHAGDYGMADITDKGEILCITAKLT